MAEKPIDRSLGDGVFYAASDYIGFWPRLLILIVDSIVLLIGIAILGTVIASLIPALPPPILSIVLVLFIWWYEVPLKRSNYRTVAYRLMGCKIVNLRGERSSLFLLTLRTMMWGMGPFNLLFDLLWCGLDDDRQTLRDRFSSCCLVKVNAEPIGSGHVQLTRFFAGGFALMYPRVVHRKETDGSVAEVKRA